MAREIATILSGGNQRTIRSHSIYNPVFEFNFEGKTMICTSVSGHLMESDFPPQAAGWASFPIIDLFTLGTVKRVRSDLSEIQKNLRELGRRATTLALWMDCDREGENICFEVIDVVQKEHSSISICRAHFSALTKRDILGAMRNLKAPNRALSEAVEARQELDLRLGAVFTRFQTLKFCSQFKNFPKVLSFGPCQFPTLGFLVQRGWEQKGFVPEDYFTLTLQHGDTSFNSVRGPIYDKIAAAVVLQQMFDEARTRPEAEVVEVMKRPNRRRPPFPLSTVMLQKLCTAHLRISSDQCMTWAESLYQEGYISYPRTETDSFSFTDNELLDIVGSQRRNPEVSGFVEAMLADPNRKFRRPLNGGHDDKAHPPIYPTKPMPAANDGRAKLYNLIVRHFLACTSPDAVASTTSVAVVYGGEKFTTSGTTIDEKGWMEVYIYERWKSTTLPTYKQGERFRPTHADLEQHRTSPPPNLTEADLITLMDKHGIGTDATISHHIKTVVEREYVKREGSSLVPTHVGNALASAYEVNGLVSLLQPQMRAQMELAMADIAAGKATRRDVVDAAVRLYREIFQKMLSLTDAMNRVLHLHLDPVYQTAVEEVGTSRAHISASGLVECGTCGNPMNLMEHVQKERNPWFVRCDTCQKEYRVPNGRHNRIERSGHRCVICKFGVLEITNIDKGTSHTVCPYCFTSPPPGAEMESLAEFRCFHCGADCPLAKGHETVTITNCMSCKKNGLRIRSNNSGFFLACRGFPVCNFTIKLPPAERVSLAYDARCPSCSAIMLKFDFGGSPAVPGVQEGEKVCVFCDARMKEHIRTKGNNVLRGSRSAPQERQLAQQQQPRPAYTLPSIDVNSGLFQIPPGLADGAATPLCHCGLPAVHLVSGQAASRGRRFVKCDGSKCQFFQWLD